MTDWIPEGHPGVVDLSRNNQGPHLDDDEFYAACYEADIRLVIHKATQGNGWVDPKYTSRRKLAVDNKLHWEAYHFYDNSPVEEQIAHFIAAAELDSAMRGALDCETEPNGRTIQPIPANHGAALIDQKRGIQALRYSGAGYITHWRIPLMKDFLAGPFWLAKYGPHPTGQFLAAIGVDPKHLVLWQETATGNIGGQHPVDLSYFHGTMDELANWPTLTSFPAPSPQG